jgi:hypothetical protein
VPFQCRPLITRTRSLPPYLKPYPSAVPLVPSYPRTPLVPAQAPEGPPPGSAAAILDLPPEAVAPASLVDLVYRWAT